MRSLRDLDDAAILLRDIAALVFAEDGLPLDQWRAALFEKLPRDDLVAAMAEADAIARPHDAKPYAELREKWRRARRLFFNIVTRLQMEAAPGGKAVQEAMRYLAKIADWSAAKMRDAPTEAIPKAWKSHVLDAEGRVMDSRAYVFAIIDAWRAAVKRRDIFASPGTRYGDPRRGMLDGAAWQASKLVVCRALNRSLDADVEITGLAKTLDEAYRAVAARAPSNADLRFETGVAKPALCSRRSTGWKTQKVCVLCARPFREECQGPPFPICFWKTCSAPASRAALPISTSARPVSSISKLACVRHWLPSSAISASSRSAGKMFQHCLTQLNHTELRHRLGRRIHHGERGEIRSALREEQEEQLGSLGLALNAVAHGTQSTCRKPFARSDWRAWMSAKKMCPTSPR